MKVLTRLDYSSNTMKQSYKTINCYYIYVNGKVKKK